MAEDVSSLSLALDLNNIDLNSILPPFEPKGGARGRRPAPQPFDVVAAQRKALALGPQTGDLLPVSTDSVFGPQRAKAETSLLHGPALGGGRCGERLQFTVTAAGQDGTILRTGGHRVTALVHGLDILSKYYPEPKPWVEDLQDGNFVVQFVCATPGRYDVTAYVDGMPLPMCPVRIEVTPGPASAMKSELGGPGTDMCHRGQQSEFTIFARDEFGNPCDEGGARFGVRALGHAQLHEVADNEDGTYLVVYSVPEYCAGPVRLEVLLDGALLKGSPVCPHVPPREDEGALPDLPPTGGGLPGLPGVGMADQIAALRWLREHPPASVPDLPAIGEIAEGGPLAVHGGDPGLPVGALDAPSAARLAWRTADEWRRLNEVRAEMERARLALLEHQAVLLSVGGTLHEEFSQQQDRARNLDSKSTELGEVENRLDAVRNDMWRQQANRQRALMESTEIGVSRPRSPSPPPPERRLITPGSPGSSGGTRSPRSPSPIFGARPGSPQPDRWDVPPEFSRGSPACEPVQGFGGFRGISEPLPPPRPPPALDPDQLGRARWGPGPPPPAHASRNYEDMPPPMPPPVFDSQRQGDRLLPGSPERTLRLPPAGSPSGGAGGYDSWSSGPGLLAAPPPPPAPPPAVVTTETDFSAWSAVPLNSRSQREALLTPAGRPRAAPAPAAGRQAAWGASPGGRSPAASGGGAAGGGHTPEELGQAMRQLFHAFASRDPGSQDVRIESGAARPLIRGGNIGKSGRVTMGLQDYLRLASAAQIRLPSNELEAVFRTTAQRFGSGLSATDPTLAFELFVELLVETARMRYGDLRDAESTAALFEEHLLPLAHRLRDLDASAL